ncbi:DUF6515 family protein [Pontimicrobium sp. IMCC45349]|uniref:DUF6515 family protein n=1 Tax=Pontimicrobium sp. IMCC45349 TaxID=3391574 RepID=UPI0039A18B0C
MKIINQTLSISLLLVTFLISGQVYGQKRGNNNNRSVKSERSIGNDRVITNNKVGTTHRYRTQPIRRNPHYRYPKHRRVIRTLPRHHVRILYRGLPYYYYSGVYYTVYGDQYIVVMPPVGFRIGVLPVGYVRIVVGPSVYFYHSGVYYTETVVVNKEEDYNSEEKYQVTSPPVGVEVSELPEDVEEISIDGKVLYEYNDVFYKKVESSSGEITYKVVYSKTDSNE